MLTKSFCLYLNLKFRHVKWQLIRNFSTHPPPPSSSLIRRQFIDFFHNQHQHEFVRSSPVCLPDDPTLLFVNAGMNQFKPIFLGTINPSHPLSKCRRVVNSQKCIRIGGKHNDLEEVGDDGHHHTFFEMLGNWSFADYFKEEACRMCWQFLTEILHLPKDKLYVTYFGGDEKLGLKADLQCKEIWLKLGVDSDKVLSFGCKDNFWSMGELGPCGPCTEIHYVHASGDLDQSNVSNLVNKGDSRVVEVWNLVFIQFERMSDGSLRRLPHEHVDTGMGLERLMAILQNSRSNYDTDLFIPLFDVIQKSCSIRPYSGLFGSPDVDGIDRAYRIIADHARMLAVSLSDGILPDKEGPGHVVRRLIRRSCLMASSSFNSRRNLVSAVASRVCDILGDAFPELITNRKRIIQEIDDEEEKFLFTLKSGTKYFKERVSNLKSNVFSGEDLLKLNIEFGLQKEFLEDLVSQRNLIPDWETFEKLKQAEREKSQLACQMKHAPKDLSQTLVTKLKNRGIKATDDQYKYQSVDCSLSARIVGMIIEGDLGEEINEGQSGSFILNRTNFYSYAGGQENDVGIITCQNGLFKVADVRRNQDYIEHRGKVIKGRFTVEENVDLQVDKATRNASARSHTATHLLAESLTRISSTANPRSFNCGSDSLRMEFTTKKRLSTDVLQKIEQTISKLISEDVLVESSLVSHSNMGQFPNLRTQTGEFYPDPMRVIAITTPWFSSTEACCGTHVKSTGKIGRVVIVAQKSKGQSTRLLSAVTGDEAERLNKYGIKLKSRFEEIRKELIEGKNTSNDEIHDVVLKKIKSLRTELSDNSSSYVIRLNLESELDKLERENKRARTIRQRSLSQISSPN